eukprot:91348_1
MARSIHKSRKPSSGSASSNASNESNTNNQRSTKSKQSKSKAISYKSNARKCIQINSSKGQNPDIFEENPRKRRARPGTRALREIRKYQKSTDLLLLKLPF